MGGYDTLPESVKTDIDIAIEPNGLEQMDKLLLMLSYRHEMRIIQKINHGYKKYAYVLSPIYITEPFRLQLDFYNDFGFKSIPCLLSFNDLIKGRKKYKTFFIPSLEVEFILILLRRIYKNDMDETYLEKLRRLYEFNNKECYDILKVFFKNRSDEIVNIILNTDLKQFREKVSKFKTHLILHSIYKSPWYSIYCFSSELVRYIRRFVNPVGMMVVFLGPDGVGKSTIAKEVSDIVWGSFHGIKHIYWRPGLFLPFGRVKFWQSPEIDLGINPRPHNRPKQSRIISLIRFFYYTLDFIIGYYPKIYFPMVKRKLVVMDRYYYDFLVDLQRYNFNIPKWLPKIILPIIPKPDLTFYLYNKPQNIIKRKRELPLSEVERQIKAFSKIITQLPNAHPINTEGSIKDISSKIASIILEKKSADTRKTLNLK